jgi:hypothetical protein
VCLQDLLLLLLRVTARLVPVLNAAACIVDQYLQCRKRYEHMPSIDEASAATHVTLRCCSTLGTTEETPPAQGDQIACAYLKTTSF